MNLIKKSIEIMALSRVLELPKLVCKTFNPLKLKDFNSDMRISPLVN